MGDDWVPETEDDVECEVTLRTCDEATFRAIIDEIRRSQGNVPIGDDEFAAEWAEMQARRYMRATEQHDG